MTSDRAIAHLFIFAYVSVLLSALIFAMTRTAPLWPKEVFYHFYAMMAPYQSDSDINTDIVAEGLNRGGRWEKIDLNLYFPQGLGEANARRKLEGVESLKTEEDLQKGYRQLAAQVRALEAKNKRSYSAIRLYRDTWPKSHAGFEALHTPENTTHAFLLQVP